MSARNSIADAIRTKLAEELNGASSIYVSNLYGNVGNKVQHFDNIMDYPFVSVTPGPEDREVLPSMQTWGLLTLYIRIYVSNADNAQAEVEEIISDIENFIDINQRLSYNITKPGGVTESKTTVSCDVISIQTDEGLLDPYGLGEVTVSIRYEKNRII